jgi:hypothetical protein
MDLAGVQRLMCFLPPISLLPSITHNSTQYRAAIVFSNDAPACAEYADRSVRLGPASPDTAPEQWHPHTGCFRISLDHVT